MPTRRPAPTQAQIAAAARKVLGDLFLENVPAADFAAAFEKRGLPMHFAARAAEETGDATMADILSRVGNRLLLAMLEDSNTSGGEL